MSQTPSACGYSSVPTSRQYTGTGNRAAPPGSEVMELEHAIGFSGLRSSLHILPGSSRYVSVAGGCVVIGSYADAHDQTFLRGHDDDITCMRLSESGRYIVSGQRGHNADICMWDAESLQVVRRFSEHDEAVLALDISPDDTIIASIGQERRLAFFDTSNGGIITHTPLSLIVPPTDDILECTFGGRAQDTKRRETSEYHFCVVTNTRVMPFYLNPYEGTLRSVNLKMPTFQRRFTTARYTSNGDFLLIGSEAGDVAVVNTQHWNVATTARICAGGIREIVVSGGHQPDQQRDLSNQASFKYARFGPGSERTTLFFAGGGDGTVAMAQIPDHADPSVVVKCKRTAEGPVCALSAVGSSGSTHTVLVGTANGFTSLLELSSSAEVSRTTPLRVADAVTAPYNLIVAHPCEPSKFVTASKDGVLRLWDLNSYGIDGAFEGNANKDGKLTCSAVCISDGLEIQLSSWSDGSVRCHDLPNFKLLWTHANAHRSPITSLCLSQSTKYFVTGSAEGEIKVWDIRTREMRGELKDHKQAVVHLQLFDDDKHLLSASKDRTVCTWDLTTMKRVTCHETHNGPLTGAILSRNQCNVYTTGQDHRICMWDLRYKEVARNTAYNAPGSDAYATCLRRNMDERLLVTGGTDQLVKLWDERMFSTVSVGIGHSGTVTDVAFTADNKQVLSCGADTSVMIWNVYA